MMGMDEISGKVINGEQYVRQCVRRVLRSFKYSMLMHREIGPDILPYIAQPTTDVWMLSLTGEVTQGIEDLLPGVRVLAVSAEPEDGLLHTSVSIQWQESVFSVDSAA